MTILIVEDDECIRSVMTLMLGSEGYDVVSAPNGEQALAWLRAHGHIDLVLTDLMMPIKDGWRLVEQIRADDSISTTPIVVVTGLVDPEHLPPDIPVLSKPFKMTALLDTVRARCRKSLHRGPKGGERPSDTPPSA